jgi:hypothetical protein
MTDMAFLLVVVGVVEVPDAAATMVAIVAYVDAAATMVAIVAYVDAATTIVAAEAAQFSCRMIAGLG